MRNWRQTFQGYWWAFAAVAAGGAAAMPLLLHGLPQSYDAPMHLARIGALYHTILQGDFYPRWTPMLLLGHGYPVFNFYAPGAYYLSIGLLAFGVNAYWAYAGAFALLLPLAALGMAVWARDVWARDDAAVVAAAAYAFAPYLLVNVYIRGSLAEVSAQALLPWVLWGFRRLMRSPHPGWFVAPAALALGGLALSHNLTLLFTSPFLLLYLAVLWRRSRVSAHNLRAPNLRVVAQSLGLAMGLSAFFWLPMIVERGELAQTAYAIAREGWLPDNVWRWENVVQGAWVYAYRFERPVPLGLVQLLVAGLGMGAAWRRDVARREVGLLLAAVMAAAVFAGAWALPIWQEVRILTLVQFPWRVLVLISPVLALAAGGVMLLPMRRRWRAAFGLLALVVVVGAHYPRLAGVPVYAPASVEITPDHVAQVERYKGAILGGEQTSSLQEFKPRWTDTDLVLESAQSGGALQVDLLSGDPWRKTMVVTATRPAAVSLNQFFFPGWGNATGTVKATENEPDGALYPRTDMGLFTARIPAGVQELTLAYRGTWVAYAANGITLITLLGWLVWAWLGSPPRRQGLIPALLLVLGGAAVLAPPAQGMADADPPKWAGAGVELMGYRVDQLTPNALHISPTWWVTSPPPDGLRVRWQLVEMNRDEPGEAGAIVADAVQAPYYNSYSAAHWPPQTLVDDGYALSLPPGLAPGRYQLRGQFQVDDDPLGAPTNLGKVDLETATPAVPRPAYPLDVQIGDGIELRGYDLDVLSGAAGASGIETSGTETSGRALPVVQPGARLRYTLWWQADPPPRENYHGFVHLVDVTGAPLTQVDQLPGPLFQPPMLWDAAQPAPDVYTIRIPDEARGGLYWPLAGLYAFPSQERLPVWGEAGAPPAEHLRLTPVKVLSRLDAEPAARTEVGVGEFATWIGYDLDPDPALTGRLQPGETLDLSLYYRSTGATEGHYTRFVHLVHETAGLVAQADGIPQDGANPTWAWVPGETIHDPVTVTLPPDAPAGRYQLVMGFYDPAAEGARAPLQAASGEEARVLPNERALVSAFTIP